MAFWKLKNQHWLIYFFKSNFELEYPVHFIDTTQENWGNQKPFANIQKGIYMCILFIKKDFGKINWVFTMFEIIGSHLYVSKAEYSYIL